MSLYDCIYTQGGNGVLGRSKQHGGLDVEPTLFIAIGMRNLDN